MSIMLESARPFCSDFVLGNGQFELNGSFSSNYKVSIIVCSVTLWGHTHQLGVLAETSNLQFLWDL